MNEEKLKEGTFWKNKWNRKKYEIVDFKGKNITLKRPDNSQLTIEIFEFKKNYEPAMEK